MIGRRPEATFLIPSKANHRKESAEPTVRLSLTHANNELDKYDQISQEYSRTTELVRATDHSRDVKDREHDKHC